MFSQELSYRNAFTLNAIADGNSKIFVHVNACDSRHHPQTKAEPQHHKKIENATAF